MNHKTTYANCTTYFANSFSIISLILLNRHDINFCESVESRNAPLIKMAKQYNKEMQLLVIQLGVIQLGA
jgi:hypothetical protein